MAKHIAPFAQYREVLSAIWDDDTDALRTLLRRCVDVNVLISPSNLSLLGYAITHGRLAAVDVLLEAGADVTCVDEVGHSALNLAYWSESPDTFEKMLNLDPYLRVSSLHDRWESSMLVHRTERIWAERRARRPEMSGRLMALIGASAELL